MTLESAVSFFVAILVFGVTPGPGVFAIMARALTHGTRSCLMLALGMSISDIAYLVAACFGLAVIADQLGGLFTIIRFAGAIYLFYLGWRMWNAPLNLDTDVKARGKHNAKAGHISGFIQGVLISASNPKVILFYIAFLPTFMDLTVLDGHDILLAAILTFAGLMLGLMTIAMFAAKARKWFQSEAATQRLNRGTGSMMLAAGAYIASR